MSKTNSDPITVAIIGGGPGGLMAAYLLQKEATSSFQIKLFEASARLGGKIVTQSFTAAPGTRYEAGAAEFYDYSQLGPDPLRTLIAELGLTTSPMDSGGAIFRERLVRTADDIRREMGDAAWKALFRFGEKARSLISASDYYESDWRKDNNEAISRTSFHDFINEVESDVARDYIRIMVHSDLACEPHQTNANYGLQNYLMDEPDYMALYAIDGGNEALIHKLAGKVTAEMLTRHTVVAVGAAPGGGYAVTSRHDDGRLSAETFDYVIVALPNDSLLTIRWEGKMLREAMDRHHQFYDHPAHYLRVTFLFDRPFWRGSIEGSFFMSDAFDGCCLYDETSRLDNEDKGVLGVLIAGDAALRLANLIDADLIGHVLKSLPRILQPASDRLIEARVHRWLGSVNALPSGFPAREPDSRHRPEPVQHPGLFVMGDYLFDSTINGVLDSADTVVDWIVTDSAADNIRRPIKPAAQ
jgi:protoporphyrinogen oxidase